MAAEVLGGDTVLRQCWLSGDGGVFRGLPRRASVGGGHWGSSLGWLGFGGSCSGASVQGKCSGACVRGECYGASVRGWCSGASVQGWCSGASVRGLLLPPLQMVAGVVGRVMWGSCWLESAGWHVFEG